MKKISLLLLAIFFVISYGCSKETKAGFGGALENPASIAFGSQTYALTVKDTSVVSIDLVDYMGIKMSYDLVKNKNAYVFSTENASIATVDEHGVLMAKGQGKTNITIQSRDGGLKATAAVEVKPSTVSTTGITRPLSKELIYSKNARIRTMSAVMQSFDVDTKGNLYYSQLNRKYRAYISYGSPDKKYSEVMTLNYFGHVSNFSIEESGEDRYLWIDNLSSKNNSGDYWGSPIVSRVKFENGKKVNSWETADNYYCGINNISVAVDVEHDMLTILGISTGDVITYRLSEAQKLDPEPIAVHVVYGGESNNEDDPIEHDTTFEVSAHDLRKLTPLGQFVSERIGDVSWQGFDINNGIFYQAEGNANKNDGKEASIAYLTIRDINGEVLEERTPVAAISDINALIEYDITDTGSMEAEGVKIRNGQLFMGFCSKGSDDARTATVFQYQPYQQ